MEVRELQVQVTSPFRPYQRISPDKPVLDLGTRCKDAFARLRTCRWFSFGRAVAVSGPHSLGTRQFNS